MSLCQMHRGATAYVWERMSRISRLSKNSESELKFWVRNPNFRFESPDFKVIQVCSSSCHKLRKHGQFNFSDFFSFPLYFPFLSTAICRRLRLSSLSNSLVFSTYSTCFFLSSLNFGTIWVEFLKWPTMGTDNRQRENWWIKRDGPRQLKCKISDREVNGRLAKFPSKVLARRWIYKILMTTKLSVFRDGTWQKKSGFNTTNKKPFK